MSYEQVLTFSHNTNPVNQTISGTFGNDNLIRSLFYQTITFLLGNGWTCISSCNSIVANLGNNIPAFVDCVAATNVGGVFSWMYLKSPVGLVAGTSGTSTGEQSRLHLCIGLQAFAASTPGLSITLSRAALVGGSPTAMPSFNAATGFNVHTQFMPNNSNTGGKLFHFSAEQNGGFAVRMTRAASGVVEFCLRLSKLVDVPNIVASGLPFPFAINFFYRVGSTSMVETTTELLSRNNNYGFSKDGLPIKQYLSCLKNDLGEVIGEATGASGNYNSKNESSFMTVSGHTEINSGANAKGVIGRIADLRITGAAVPQASVDSEVSPTFCFVGCCHIPTNVIINF